METPRDVTDEDQHDDATASYDKRISAAMRLIMNSTARLDDINTHFEDPPVPDKPRLLSLLTDLKARANDAIAQADTLAILISRGK